MTSSERIAAKAGRMRLRAAAQLRTVALLADQDASLLETGQPPHGGHQTAILDALLEARRELAGAGVIDALLRDPQLRAPRETPSV